MPPIARASLGNIHRTDDSSARTRDGSSFRATVLVVDDSPDNAALLCEVLRSCCEIRVAANGFDALTIIESDDPPDLILLDVMMPGISGLDVCRKLQGNSARRSIPVIFVSGLGKVEDECRGLAVGAVDYIRKPIDPPIVRARVRIHLDLAHLRGALARRNAVLEAKASERLTGRSERAIPSSYGAYGAAASKPR